MELFFLPERLPDPSSLIPTGYQLVFKREVPLLVHKDVFEVVALKISREHTLGSNASLRGKSGVWNRTLFFLFQYTQSSPR